MIVVVSGSIVYICGMYVVFVIMVRWNSVFPYYRDLAALSGTKLRNGRPRKEARRVHGFSYTGRLVSFQFQMCHFLGGVGESNFPICIANGPLGSVDKDIAVNITDLGLNNTQNAGHCLY